MNSQTLTYPDTQTLPLTTVNGIIRIADSRVGLDVVVDAFHQGATPEEIALNYDTLNLADIYAVIAYYLANRQAVDNYVEQLIARGEQIRLQTEPRFGLDTLREQLRQRRPSPSA